MDVNQYIETGILESYAMGQASSQEQREVQCLSKIYPEIAEELKRVEAHLETFATASKRTAPASLKSSILAAIEEVDQEPAMSVVKDTQPKPAPRANIKSIEPKIDKPRFSFAAAASIILAIGLAGMYYVYASDRDENRVQIAQLKEENAAQSKALESVHNELVAITDPSVTQIKLVGTENYPQSVAQVYWNNETGDVILDSKYLAELPSDQQYQLWVLVDGDPVDMGMVPVENDSELLKMKTTKAGQHFAITIEKAGGSPTPNLEQMVVFGTVPTT